MSRTIEVKVEGTKFNADAVVATLKRMGFPEERIKKSNRADHFLVDYKGRVRTEEAPAQVWITRVGASNEIGFCADKDGYIKILNNYHDSTSGVFKKAQEDKFRKFIPIESVKVAAAKKGVKNLVEVKVGNQIKLLAQ